MARTTTIRPPASWLPDLLLTGRPLVHLKRSLAFALRGRFLCFEAAVERNTGMKRSALEVAGLLRDAAAAGQAKGQDPVAAPEKQPPEKDRSIVRPFEIGI